MALFVFQKKGQKLFVFFLKKINFVKCYIWGMIYIGNLILRTMALEYFKKSTYFKSYGRF